MVKFTFPYPPTANLLTSTLVVKGRAIRCKTAAARKYKVAAHKCIEFEREPYESLIGVRLSAFRPRRVGDIDNIIKACLDAMSFDKDVLDKQGNVKIGERAHWVWKDDEQVKELHVTMNDDKHNPRVEVEVWELAGKQENLEILEEETLF
ncbi:MAG TPA: hypothetical protein VMS08_00435 [Candidatus Saccharimonadia bacterium]|nr:hypothetical protein [Candidatus Saccharimonadia bacterium]